MVPYSRSLMDTSCIYSRLKHTLRRRMARRRARVQHLMHARPVSRSDRPTWNACCSSACIAGMSDPRMQAFSSGSSSSCAILAASARSAAWNARGSTAVPSAWSAKGSDAAMVYRAQRQSLSVCIRLNLIYCHIHTPSVSDCTIFDGFLPRSSRNFAQEIAIESNPLITDLSPLIDIRSYLAHHGIASKQAGASSGPVQGWHLLTSPSFTKGQPLIPH